MALAIPAPMRATDGGRPFTSLEWIYDGAWQAVKAAAAACGIPLP
jgi:hypothetical protein